MPVSVEEGYRLWSGSYDHDRNPVLALERRVLGRLVRFVPGQRFLDIATGTGYWLDVAESHGMSGFGVDVSADMLAQASLKPRLRGRLVRGDINALPFRHRRADVAICSFALGYLSEIEFPMQEMARVARMVIVSDLHEDAVKAGWRRGFQVDGRHYEIEHFAHSIETVDRAAANSGLILSWRETAYLGEPERAIFEHAGRSWAFEQAVRTPAIAVACWIRP